MKPRKEGGVVDSKLNIYGIKGLNVADVNYFFFSFCTPVYLVVLIAVLLSI